MGHISTTRGSLHILHVIDSLMVGGAERALVEIANQSVGDGYRVSVCVTRTPGKLHKELNPYIRFYSLDRRKKIDLKAMKVFSRIVLDESVDILHVYGRSSFAFIAFLKTFRFISLDLPVIMNDQTGIYMEDAIPPWFLHWGKRFVSKYVGVYEDLRQWALSAGIPKENIHIIDNAINPLRFAHAPKIDIQHEFQVPNGSIVGVTIGGLRREKGIDVLLDAINLSKNKSSAMFLIIGGDRDPVYAKSCRDYALELGIERYVRFTGERDDVPSILSSSDFAVLSSRSEGSPNVLMEYLFSSLPVISTRVGGFVKKLEEEGIREFVSPQNPVEMANAIDNLLAMSHEERIERGKMGQGIAESALSINEVIKKWYNVYSSFEK